jgi:hypothetical protein
VKPLSADTIEKTCLRMWNMSEGDAYKLSFDLEKQQPVLVAYLAAVDTDILNQAEREMLFYLGTLVWQIMTDQNKNLPGINENAILQCEETNLKLADSLKKADTMSFSDVVKNILKNYNQPEVFRYIVAILLEEENDESPIRDENLGILMLDLKTIIDCFDKSIQT